MVCTCILFKFVWLIDLHVYKLHVHSRPEVNYKTSITITHLVTFCKIDLIRITFMS